MKILGETLNNPSSKLTKTAPLVARVYFSTQMSIFLLFHSSSSWFDWRSFACGQSLSSSVQTATGTLIKYQ